MKKNLILPISAAVFAMGATGCLEKKEEAVQLSNREALITALDNQAVGLIDSLNKVVVSGNFMANLSLENPPEPIPLEGDDDIKKAIDYLFSNEVVNGNTSTYTPDPRICSEILAKNNPGNCQKVFAKISFSQEASDADTGYVQVTLDGSLPLGFVYDSSLVSLNVSLPGIFESLEKVDAILVAGGQDSFADELPQTRDGAVTLTVASQMGASIVDFSISQAIQITGVTSEGRNYSVSVGAANNIATVSLIPSLGIGTLSINVPAASALIDVNDHLNALHPVAVNFPGLSGQLTLNNAASMIESNALQLLASSVTASVDGQPGFQLDVTAPLNAQLIASASDITLNFSTAFSAFLQVSNNALVDEAGSVSADIAQDTALLFAKNSQQAEVLSGSFSLIGSGDFSVNLDAQPGMCIEGQDEAFGLQTAACQ